MSIDFTSLRYPFLSKYSPNQSEEGHDEPADETLKTSVKDADHPLFSPTGLKDSINLRRTLANSKEPLIEKDVPDEVIKASVGASLKNKYPYDNLIYAVDYKKKLDENDGSGIDDIAKQLLGFATSLVKSQGRQPLNFEMLMAFALEDPSKVKSIVQKAIDSPLEIAEALGSKFDDIIMQKPKFDKMVPRNNKEIVQYFGKRMILGNNVVNFL